MCVPASHYCFPLCHGFVDVFLSLEDALLVGHSVLNPDVVSVRHALCLFIALNCILCNSQVAASLFIPSLELVRHIAARTSIHPAAIYPLCWPSIYA